jgi:tripartite-type tricarboxylate transporter receptor subunit TctC
MFLKYIVAAATALMPATHACAADTFPAHPIRFIVPYAPGGNGDIVGRVLAQRLAGVLGQQIVIDNRAGAGGNIGAELAARAAPDGYTLVLGTNTHVINMSLYARLSYDLVKDFAPISLLSSAPLVLITHPSVPAKSVAELIALAKANPGKLNYGSGGSGSTAHIITEMFRSAAGINIVHVPYKGVSQSLTDLIAGQIQIVFNATSTAMAHIQAGRVRGLAVSTATRTALAPGVPTIAESGLPGFDARNWQGVLAPARTPPAIVAFFYRDIANLLKTPEMREQLFAQGVDAMSSTPEQFSAYIKDETVKWGRAIKAAGAKVD